MRPAEWIQTQPLLAAGLLGVVLGLATGLAWPVEVPPMQTRTADPWAPPAGLAGARPLESEFAAVRNAPAWGNAGAAGAAGEGDKRAQWQLTGIIADPQLAALVLPAGSAEIKRVRAGGALPDGGLVQEVLASSVIFVRDGCMHERLLYGPVEPTESEPCNPGTQAVK